MRRAAAFLVYYLGIAFGIGAVVTTAKAGGVWDIVVAPVAGLPIWWIAAGIGIRLGLYPSEFFAAAARVAGLIEPLDDASERGAVR